MLRLLRRPEVKGLDLESERASEVHAGLIRTKPLLRKLYEGYYDYFCEADASAPSGLRLEIGSGGGFLHERIPSLISVDVRPGAVVDLKASAMDLPLEGRSVGCVFMLNVLHHLPHVERFFSELERVLVPGGMCVMVEPYVSEFSKLLYGRFHHEPFDPGQRGWSFEEGGAMTAANDALPWIVFERDRDKFQELFPDLELTKVRPHTVLSYIVSGGLSFRSALPGPLFTLVQSFDDALCSLTSNAATMMTVQLTRRTNSV